MISCAASSSWCERCTAPSQQKANSKMPINARSQVSYILLYVLIGALALEAFLVIARGELTKSALGITSILILVTIVSWWIKAVQSRRRIEIDARTRQVTIHAVSAFFSPIKNHYPLDQFGSVRSYTTIGRFPKNQVELVTKSGGEALMVAAFVPGISAPSFWSVPKEVESAKARYLRKEISRRCGLIDQGFLGSKLVGALLETDQGRPK